MIRTKEDEMHFVGMIIMCITQDDDNASDIGQFLLQRQSERACSGWIVASKTTTDDIPPLCHVMANFVEFLNIMLENGMSVTNGYVLNMMAQTNYPLAKPSVKCLLRCCSAQQRLELFKAVSAESDINEKCNMLVEILVSGDIDEKFKPVVSDLIAKYPDLFKKSNSLMEELIRLKHVDPNIQSTCKYVLFIISIVCMAWHIFFMHSWSYLNFVNTSIILQGSILHYLLWGVTLKASLHNTTLDVHNMHC